MASGNYIRIVMVAVLSLLLCEATAFAEGHIVLKPLLYAGWRYDDNFYKSEKNERGVHTYLIRPGFDVGYETAESNVKLHYTLDAYYYDDADSPPSGQPKASEDDFVGHTAELNLKTRLFERLTAGLDDSYKKTRNSAYSDQFSNSEQRYRYWINRLSPYLIYDFVPRVSLATRYRNTKADFEEKADYKDFDENRGIFDLIYRFSRLDYLDLEYQVWARNYDEETYEYTSNQVKVKYHKQYKYVAFEVGAGYHERDFEQDAYDDADIFTYRFVLQAQNPPLPRTKPKSRLVFTAEHNFNDLGDDFYTADRFSLEMGRLFFDKAMISIGGYYQIADYENETGPADDGGMQKREDDYYTVYATVGYEWSEWLVFQLELGLEDRDSNLAGRDYDNFYFQFGLDLAFDLGSK